MTFPIFNNIVNNTNLNTSPSSLVAQLALSRSDQRLSTVIENLSTGLQVTSGRDDPSGFISSSILRGEIVMTKQAITNYSTTELERTVPPELTTYRENSMQRSCTTTCKISSTV